MARRDITPEQAAGMLAGIRSQHSCTEACNATIRLGGPYGKVVTLACPWSRLDVNSLSDRGVIATVYADMVRSTMEGV